MQLLTLDRLCVVLITLTLLRFLLSKSNLSTLLTVCLGSCLSYCFFENTLSFFPLVFYLLKSPLECFFLFLKKSFASFKEFLSFTGNETEEKDVGANQSVRMEKSGNQAETDNPLPTGKSNFDGEQEEGQVEREDGVFVVEIRKEHIKLGVGVVLDVSQSLVHAGFAYTVARSFIQHSFPHLTACTGSATLRRFGSISTIGVWIGAYLLLYASNKVGNDLKESLEKRVNALLDGAIPVNELPERMEQAQAARKELERTLNTHLFFKECVSGQLLLVTNEKTIEFLSGLLEDILQMVKDNKFDVTLLDVQNLPDSEKEFFSQIFKRLSSQDESSLLNQHPDFYRDIVVLGKSMVEPEALGHDLIALNKEQKLVFRGKESGGATSQLDFMDPLNYSSLARVKARFLPHPSGSTLGQYADDIRTKPISPGFSYDQFYKTIDDMGEHVKLSEKSALNETRSYLRGLPSTSQQPLDNQKKPFVSEAGTSLRNQDPPSPGSPPWSPLEKRVIEKDPHLAYFGIGLGVMLVLCQTCVGVLRRLGYTQEFVKTMTGKGYPKWLFSWLSHPNPKPFPEKSVFDLLVLILIFNVVILYVLFKML